MSLREYYFPAFQAAVTQGRVTSIMGAYNALNGIPCCATSFLSVSYTHLDVYKRQGSYYLMCAEGGTLGPPTAHMAVLARSKSINGPWENSPYNPVVHTSGNDEKWWNKGHGSLIDTPDGNWYIVYHAYRCV